jgi:hypothetical protein
MYSFEERCKLVDALTDVKEKYYSFWQGKYMSLQCYHELFLAQVQVMDEVGVTIANEALVQQVAMSNGHVNAARTTQPTDTDRATAREQSMAMRFICRVSGTYKSYLTHLHNSFLDGSDLYPTTLHEAYNILQWREGDNTNTGLSVSDCIAFTTMTNVTCYNCGKKEHIARDCMQNQTEQGQGNQQEQQSQQMPRGQGTRFITIHSFSLSHGCGMMNIPPTWLLLDNQSTVNVLCNANLLDDIHEVEDEMEITSNSGSNITSQMGTLPGYGQVWHDPNGIVNIVSLSQVKERYHVRYDNDHNVFVVTKPDGTIYEFIELNSSLYYYNLAVPTNKHSTMVLVDMVASKQSKYTNEDYLRAVTARNLLIRIGRPSLKDFMCIVMRNQLTNCPITRADILAAEDIFGPDLGMLKGKTTWTCTSQRCG